MFDRKPRVVVVVVVSCFAATASRLAATVSQYAVRVNASMYRILIIKHVKHSNAFFMFESILFVSPHKTNDNSPKEDE